MAVSLPENDASAVLIFSLLLDLVAEDALPPRCPFDSSETIGLVPVDPADPALVEVVRAGVGPRRDRFLGLALGDSFTPTSSSLPIISLEMALTSPKVLVVAAASLSSSASCRATSSSCAFSASARHAARRSCSAFSATVATYAPSSFVFFRSKISVITRAALTFFCSSSSRSFSTRSAAIRFASISLRSLACLIASRSLLTIAAAMRLASRRFLSVCLSLSFSLSSFRGD
mmetsp:Transcript_13425/g.38355  ORF Transcript_13425/g.38355 Transcript_13425/m.38355 type:complete len:231 (+) Transcript_13425:711-1403(+)